MDDVAKEYQKLTPGRKFYSTKKIYILAPRFIMLYNGTEDLPDKFERRLSDLYNPMVTEPELELKVMVYNINYGHNEALMERCSSLREYALYVDKVRNYNKTMSIEEAVIYAIEECIKEGLLRDFLISQKREVIAMSIYEYDEEAVLAMLAEENREDGMAQGITQGIELGEENILKLMSKMFEGGDGDKVKLLSEDIKLLETMRKKYSGDESI